MMDNVEPATSQLNIVPPAMEAEKSDDITQLNLSEETTQVTDNIPSKIKEKVPLDINSLSMFPSLSTSNGQLTENQSHHQQFKPSSSSDQVTEIFDLPLKFQVKVDKKNLSAMIRKLTKKTQTVIDISTATNTGTMTFIIKGKSQAVRKAKRELLNFVSVKVAISLPVPTAARRHIVGTKGKTLQEITSSTYTRITLPPRENEPVNENGEEDFESMTEITIEGDYEGVEMAKEEIERIVNEKTSKRVIKISHIPKECFPFILGPYSKSVQQLMSQTDTKIHIPLFHPSSNEESDSDSSSISAPVITISGEKDQVKQAVENIERIYEELKSNLRTFTIDLPKRQHRYLVGPKASTMNEIFEQTGCSLEIPPQNSTSEQIIVRGRQHQMVPALSAIMEKANSVQIQTIDLNSLTKIQNLSAKEKLDYFKNVLTYLTTKGRIKKFENEHHLQIFLPKHFTGKEKMLIEIVGKVKIDVDLVHCALFDLIKSLPPICFSTVQVDPKLHGHIIGKSGQSLSKLKEKYHFDVIVPVAKKSSENNSTILLIYDHHLSTDRILPKDAKLKESAENLIEEIQKKAKEAADFIVTKKSIPQKYHRNFFSYKRKILNEILSSVNSTVQIRFGSNQNEQDKFSDETLKDDEVLFKGPKDSVQKVVDQVEKLVEEFKQDEILHSYTVAFTVPANSSSHIIGRGGSTINRIKDKLGVRVDIVNAKTPKEPIHITIKGIQSKVEEAKNEIAAIVERLLDTIEVTLEIDHAYHRALIGQQGKNVKHLEETHRVYIKFPSNEDQANSIIIKGPSKGVEAARNELLKMAQQQELQNQSLEFTFPSKYSAHVVGRRGAKIQEIKDTTLTKISIEDQAINSASDEPLVKVYIQGTSIAIQKAKDMIERIVQEQENTIQVEIDVPSEYHRSLIGANGANIKSIVQKAADATGKKDKDPSTLVHVRFPSRNSSDGNPDVIVLNGDKQMVCYLEKHITDIVNNMKQMIKERVDVPKSQHSSIIGKQGSALRELQDRYQVEVHFPNSNLSNKSHLPEITEDQIILFGKAENVQQAKEEILSKLRIEKSIFIPAKIFALMNVFHQITIRQLKRKFPSIFIQQNNHPAKDIPAKYKELFPEDIQWIIKGETRHVSQASKMVEDAILDLEHSCEFEEIDIPSYLHRFIIGRQGSTIKQIRQETSCHVILPQDANTNSVLVMGSKDNIEKAKEHIFDLLEGYDRLIIRE